MKFVKNIIILVASIFIDLASGQAVAGSAEGPFVIWSNLGSADKNIINGIIKNYLLSGDDLCWEPSSSGMYMTKRPAEMTDDLIRDAVILKKRAAIEKLNRQLLKYEHSTTWTGFDGVIVYTDQNGPRLTSFTVKSKKIKTVEIPDIDNSGDIRFAVCGVMPPITRAP